NSVNTTPFMDEPPGQGVRDRTLRPLWRYAAHLVVIARRPHGASHEGAAYTGNCGYREEMIHPSPSTAYSSTSKRYLYTISVGTSLPAMIAGVNLHFLSAATAASSRPWPMPSITF